MAAISAEEIHALIDSRLEEERQKPPPGKVPQRVPLYHAETGEPLPDTPDGMVWRIDVAEWCATGQWVRNLSEVKPKQPKKRAVPKPAAKPPAGKQPAKPAK